MKEVFDRYVRAYDVCGLEALCDESLRPSEWNAKPDPALGAGAPWKSEITRLLLEVKEGPEDFLADMEHLILQDFVPRGLDRGEREKLRPRIRGAIVSSVGKYLYRNNACGGCELRRHAVRIDPWQPLKKQDGTSRGHGPGEADMETIETQRYQIRLRPEEKLEDVFTLLVRRIREFLDSRPDWRTRAPREEASLEGELRGVVSYYVTAYDLCGIKVSCFEMADPVPWNTAPDPFLSEMQNWRDMRILQLEVKTDLDEFFSALEAGVFRALCRDPVRAKQAKGIRHGLESAAREVFGPHLFRSMDYGCDLCKVVTPVNPWIYV